MIDLMKQKNIILMAQYGSRNYNLATSNSDVDWRGFSNIIAERNVENFGIGNNDICINSTKYLYKAITEMIPKYVEILFSDTIIISTDLSYKTRQLINELFSFRNSIVVMDLRQMYKSYLSEFYMHQDWINSNKNPRKNINYMIHSFRMLDILIRFANIEFTDYKYAICYSDTDASRKIILDFKSNKISLETFKIIMNEKLTEALSLNTKYNRRVDLYLTEKLQNIIEEISQEEVI